MEMLSLIHEEKIETAADSAPLIQKENRRTLG